jgi:hypothetical protein
MPESRLSTVSLVRALCTGVVARDWYISPSGNDASGSGSAGSPWASLGRALQAVASNDTVWVDAGLYAGSPNTGLSWSGCSNCTIVATGAAVFDCSGSSTGWLHVAGASTSVSVRGVTVQHCQSGTSAH